jgi:hypothetical protein
MQKQIPHGPEDEMCHRLWEPCSKVCFNGKLKCKLWKEFRGTDATGQEQNGWFCVDEMMAHMTMEVAKEVRQGAAATESFRNEMVSLTNQSHSDVERIGILPNGGYLLAANPSGPRF